jgi:putative membrane protein
MRENPPSALNTRPHSSRRHHNGETPSLSSGLILSFCGFGVAWLVATGVVVTGVDRPGTWCWPEAVLGGGACLTSATWMAHRLGWQNAATIGGITLLFSGAILGVSAVSAVPLGPIHFSERVRPFVFGHVPFALPFFWVAILASSRDTARLLLAPWRGSRFYGFWIVGAAASLALISDLNWEPHAVQVTECWSWLTPDQTLGWYSAPWFNFLGWFLGCVLILGFSTPWFISKRPARSSPGFPPALLWAALNLHFVLGNAARGLWPAVLVGGTLVTAVLFLAWRGPHAAKAILSQTAK